MEALIAVFRSVVSAFIATAASVLPAQAETVMVKYRGPVDLAPFGCESTPQSSLVKRLCYDAKERYVLVNLQGTWYHYCEVPAVTVSAWRRSESLGRFYNANMKGQFDCRMNRVPPY